MPHILVRIVLEAAFGFNICPTTQESSAYQAFHSRSVTGVPPPWLPLMDVCKDSLSPSTESSCCPGQPCRLLICRPEAPCKCQSSVSFWPPSDEWKLSAAVFALAYTLPGSCLDSHLISHVYRELRAGPAATRKSSYVTRFLAGGRHSDYRLYQKRLSFGCCHYETGSRLVLTQARPRNLLLWDNETRSLCVLVLAVLMSLSSTCLFLPVCRLFAGGYSPCIMASTVPTPLSILLLLWR